MPFQTFHNLPMEKRDKLINCALDEFAANDYQSSSVSKIVAKAGIAKGSLYQYFKDKSDLYTFLLEFGSRAKAELMSSTLQNNPDRPFFDTLRLLFEAMGRFEVMHPKLSRIGYRAATGKSPLPEELIRQSKMATRKYFADLMVDAKTRGEIREEVDIETAAYLLSTFLAELGNFSGIQPDRIGSESQTVQKNEAFRQAFEHVLEIFKNGIAS